MMEFTCPYFTSYYSLDVFPMILLMCFSVLSFFLFFFNLGPSLPTLSCILVICCEYQLCTCHAKYMGKGLWKGHWFLLQHHPQENWIQPRKQTGKKGVLMSSLQKEVISGISAKWLWGLTNWGKQYLLFTWGKIVSPSMISLHSLW